MYLIFHQTVPEPFRYATHLAVRLLMQNKLEFDEMAEMQFVCESHSAPEKEKP